VPDQNVPDQNVPDQKVPETKRDIQPDIGRDAEHDSRRGVESSRRVFIAIWIAATLSKVLIASRLPLFVDEAFYWQEGRHPAWAYSDLPGLTAWLTRLGVEAFGHHALSLRLPFLLLAAALPWVVVALARHVAAPRYAWQAGILATLLPLSGALGALALPDVPLAFATALCLFAGVRLLRATGRGAIDAGSALLLAFGLTIGALSHYRFIAVIGVGFIALLLSVPGRRVLSDARVWVALLIGAAAWLPLLLWNLDNADAGLRFQLVDRHPWSFHIEGLWFPLVQALAATPLLLIAMLSAVRRRRASSGEMADEDAADSSRKAATDAVADRAPADFLAWSGALVFVGFFALAFFADTERVSFHWPLPAYLALLPLAPAVLAGWRPWLRALTWILVGVGLIAALGYYIAVSSPTLRAQVADSKAYPSNFAGWDRLAREVVAMRATMPAGTRLVADNFKIGAELGFALNDPRIVVLDHPLNAHHGRAPQLALWGLRSRGRADWSERGSDAPVLLVVGATDVEYKNLLRRYRELCAMVGPLPPPRVLNIDHGRQRFLLFALNGGAAASRDCVTPAMAWIDTPESGDRLRRNFDVSGWAFKDGAGLRKVDVLLDGRVVATADYGLPRPDVAGYWKISSDPQHPNVAFRARVDATTLPPGRYWLGLRLHGRDGSIEDWPELRIVLE
jgi:4-amino-4-deoxy-L-arabinose transferase-like glycosyltransferase